MAKIRIQRNGHVYSDGEEVNPQELNSAPVPEVPVVQTEDKDKYLLQLFGYDLTLTETLQITSVALQLLSILITLIIACKLAKCQ